MAVLKGFSFELELFRRWRVSSGYHKEGTWTEFWTVLKQNFIEVAIRE